MSASGSFLDHREGMEALKDFIEMLRIALPEAMPGVKPSRTPGFSWRGYRIDEYESLARGQFFCFIRYGTPRKLLFLEEYHDTQYHFPFQLNLDLQSCGFFQADAPGQEAMLVDFIKHGFLIKPRLAD